MRISTSFVICASRLDRAGSAVEAAESALRQDLAPIEVLLVVDHMAALRDRLAQGLPAVRILDNAFGRGLSNARNTGILETRGDLVAFLDDDVVASPDWLARMAVAFSDPMVMGAGGRAVPIWLKTGQRPSWLAEEFDWVVGCTYKGFAQGEENARNVHGSNMIFRRAIFDAVGPFDPTVGGPVSGDDTELCLRIRMRPEGFQIVYNPEAIVHHKVPWERQTIRYFISNSYDEGRGKGRIRALHPGWVATLSSEKRYLKRLVWEFLPRRIERLVSSRDWTGGVQAISGLASIMAVGVGYVGSRVLMGIQGHGRVARTASRLRSAPRRDAVVRSTEAATCGAVSGGTEDRRMRCADVSPPGPPKVTGRHRVSHAHR